MKDEVDIFASDKIKDFMKTRLYVCVCMLLLMFSCDNLNVNQRLEEYAKYEKTFLKILTINLNNYQYYHIDKMRKKSC